MASKLFSPLRLGPVELANRVVIAPMCQYSADDGSATDWHLQHWMQYAYAGAGLFMAEATAVERPGRITHGCLGLYSDANEAAAARALAAARRVAGVAKFGIQLAHAGRKASSQRPWEGGQGLKAGQDPWPAEAASPIPFDLDRPAPRALDRAGIARVRGAFVAAARRAARLGFDVVELHCAHGYLLHGFLSPISNRRDDEYGGALENRMRFALETAETVRAVLPPAVAMGARLSAMDWVEGGWTIEDSVALAKRLKALGLDYVCASGGGISPKAKPPVAPGYMVPLAQRIRAEAGIATRAVGLIVDPLHAEEIVAKGQADQVALARAFLDNPRWAWHAAERLGGAVKYPVQYERVQAKLWPGAALARPGAMQPARAPAR
jgi:2,4-dienoyl-CoA reductase-like NADH-dependent reductase (Old Yellow Enzyme family)